ncbi:polymerase delta-interacting protein 3 isoform X3 [Rhea pennata]|uniref:polymerase delta-interacting protein 3 isoform X3 n=1 Tax=Rhea pennata TaxID=8795 RepID=UPI002E267739
MSGSRSLRLISGPRDKMADLSLDELIRKRGVTVKGRLNTRPVFGGVRSRIGIQQNLLSRSSPAVSFQRTFDARQKIGLTDARQKLGVKDAREKLVQKDARFKIKGKVQDAREMLNSRKQQSIAAEKVTKVVDAREKISLKRSAPATAAAISPAMGTVNPAMKITKTIQQKAPVPGHSHPAGMRINVVNNHTRKQGLYDMEDDDESVSPLPSKQMKITTTNSFLHNAVSKGSFPLLLERLDIKAGSLLPCKILVGSLLGSTDDLEKMEFQTDKCEVLLLEWDNTLQYKLRTDWLESSLAEKDLLDDILRMNQQCILAARKAICILGYISNSIATKSREIIPLYLALLRLQLYCAQFGALQYKTH